MKYILKDFNRNIPDTELLENLKKIADIIQQNKISTRQYESNGGKYSSSTISICFGSWNNALKLAGLELVHYRNVSKEELFKNIQEIWIQLGRQPVFRDFKKPLSKFSSSIYQNEFGSFRQAMEAFVEFVNSEDESYYEIEEYISENNQKDEIVCKHKTKRIPSERLKVQVLMRDGNICRLCGVVLIGENIHFDHIIPWSKGGETTLENLQILCAKHNLAKGDLEFIDRTTNEK
jgi:hypothetical protein